MQIYTKSWKTDGQMTLISAIGPKMCKKAIPIYIRSNGIEKMQFQILICYTKVNQCLNSNVIEHCQLAGVVTPVAYAWIYG